MRSLRVIVVAVVAISLLAACSDAAGESGVAAGQLDITDATLSYEEQRDLVDENADYARPVNAGPSKAAAIAYVSTVRVSGVEPFMMENASEPVEVAELRLATFEVVSIEWAKKHLWNLGEKEKFAAPEVGSVIRLGVLQDWGLVPGSEVTITVEPYTTMGNEFSQGYASYVIGSDRVSKLVDADFVALINAASSTDAGQGMGETEVLVGLAAEASVWLDDSNAIDADAELPPGLLKASVQALGLPEQASDNAQDNRFKGWLAQDSADRQLPVSFEELPGLREDKLGKNLVESQVAVVDADSDALYAVSYRNVGVLGPFATDAAINVASMLGVVPKAGRLELLRWDLDTEDIGPDTGETVFKGSIPSRWDPETEVLVFTLQDGSYDLEKIDHDAFRQLVGARVEAVDPGPRSDSDSKD